MGAVPPAAVGQVKIGLSQGGAFVGAWPLRRTPREPLKESQISLFVDIDPTREEVNLQSRRRQPVEQMVARQRPAHGARFEDCAQRGAMASGGLGRQTQQVEAAVECRADDHPGSILPSGLGKLSHGLGEELCGKVGCVAREGDGRGVPVLQQPGEHTVQPLPEARMRLFFARQLEPAQVDLLTDAAEGKLLCLLSLDGPEETNEEIRGEGSYRDGLETLNRMQAAGMEVGVNTVMLAPVLSGLPRLIRDLGRGKIRRLHLIMPHERGRLTASPALIPAPNKLLPALDAAMEAAAAAGIEIDNLSAWKSRLKGSRDLCGAGCSL